ncbi:MAG: SGNH/GDSL hydrolase family protein [Phormidesmis sp. CAN_BIN36]|nr:SGNH/GDSL hydrolase family protein [Phormidesmis sp. CAN_BIN36]
MSLFKASFERSLILSLTVLPVAAIVSLPKAAEAASFQNLYVFGDSLSDVGNVLRDTGGLVPPPVLPAFNGGLSPGYANGRFSNGPVWVEYLAKDLGLSLDTRNDFAYGGATTGQENGLNPLLSQFGFPITLPGLQQQIATFQSQNPVPDQDALYILWAGANDYLNLNLTDPQGTVQNAIVNLSTAVTTLTSGGAKNFLIANLPDLGKIPLTRGDLARSQGLSFLSSAHNTALAQTLGVLPSTLGVNIIPFDVNALINEAIANPSPFGLTNVTEQCLPATPIFPDVPPPSIPCDPVKDAPNFLFWDPLHPTTKGHEILGEYAYSVLKSKSIQESSPVVLLLALGTFFGSGAALRRKRILKQPVTNKTQLEEVAVGAE